MKHKILFLLLCAFIIEKSFGEVEHNEKSHVVELPIPKLFDGVEIKGNIIGFMMALRGFMRDMQLGVTQADGSARVGMFIFLGDKHTLQSLATLEDQYADHPEFKSCLTIAKNDFATKITPWINYGKNTRAINLYLIGEFCKKTNRPKSYLLQWASIPEGEEIPSFHKNITSAQVLDEFLTDLEAFFESFIKSCPKATQQFMYNFKLKAIKKIAMELLEAEAIEEQYLQALYIKEHIVSQVLHIFEQDKKLQESLNKKVVPDKQDVKMVLVRLLEQDKERMQQLLKILLPLLDSKKITDALVRQEIIAEVRKTVDATNQTIEKDSIKQILKRILHHKEQ